MVTCITIISTLSSSVISSGHGQSRCKEVHVMDSVP